MLDLLEFNAISWNAASDALVGDSLVCQPIPLMIIVLQSLL